MQWMSRPWNSLRTAIAGMLTSAHVRRTPQAAAIPAAVAGKEAQPRESPWPPSGTSCSLTQPASHPSPHSMAWRASATRHHLAGACYSRGAGYPARRWPPSSKLGQKHAIGQANRRLLMYPPPIKDVLRLGRDVSPQAAFLPRNGFASLLFGRSPDPCGHLWRFESRVSGADCCCKRRSCCC